MRISNLVFIKVFLKITYLYLVKPKYLYLVCSVDKGFKSCTICSLAYVLYSTIIYTLE